jgi:uncharacterized membrane protein
MEREPESGSKVFFATARENPMEMNIMQVSGLGGVIILGLDIWAIISVIGSSATTARKVVWTLLVLVLPVLGFLIWLFFGPDTRQRRA